MDAGLTTALLLGAAPALWISRWLAVALLAAAAVCALAIGLATPGGVLAMTAFALLCHIHARNPGWAVWAALLLASAALYLHLVPGLDGWRVMGPLRIGAGAGYEKWLGPDKTGAGILLLALALPGLVGRHGWAALLRSAAPLIVATPVLVLGAALLAGAVRPDVTLVPAFLWWAVLNLLTTCLSEEALFRGLIQGRLTAASGARGLPPHPAIIATALVFGLAHAPSGAGLVAFATLAGIGYGYAFHLTGRIEAAMLCHFAVNATHFLLLTYPVPAGAAG